MKGFLYTLLVLLIIGGVCVVTCPDKQTHYDEIQKVLNEIVYEELGGTEEDDLAVFGEWLSNSSVKLVLNQALSVDNYFVCSVGKLKFDGQTYPISVGVMNHVFLPDKESIREQMNQSLNEVFE